MSTSVWLALFALTQVEKPSLTARLVAAHEAVKPGGETELAVELAIQPGWHAYHRIVLDTGAPTTFTFRAPAGVSVGEVRFPRPELGQTGGMDYLAYEGKPVFLARLRVADTIAPGTDLPIGVTVRALVCKEQCVFVEAAGEVRLAVRDAMGPPRQPRLFEDARAALPAPLASARGLKGSEATLTTARVPIGGSGELVVVLRIEPGLHIQDRDPGSKDLIAARLFIESLDGVEFALNEQRWPEPKVANVEGFGRVRQHTGRIEIRTPFRVSDPRLKPGPRDLLLLVQYQACNDAGQCFPPELAEARLRLEVLPAGADVTTDAPVPDAPVATQVDSPPVPAAPTSDGAARSSADVSPATDAASAAGVIVLPEVLTPGIVTDALRSATGSKVSNEPVPLWKLLFWAFLGGAILNIMPCVLPVISLKIFSFMRQGGESRGRILALGAAYAGGILASFAVLAVMIASFKLAWGGFMQSPTYVIVLIAIIVAFSLSLFGLFEIQLPGRAADALGSASEREGFGGAFANGVFATALATPCTAPFLAAALGHLTRLPTPLTVLGVMTVGVGLAAPYVLLTAFPAWLRFVPRPGNWMIVFKQFMGFVLLGTAVWLLWILSYLVAPAALVGVMALLCFVGLGCWLIGMAGLGASWPRWAAAHGAAVAAVVAGAFCYRWLATGVAADAGTTTVAEMVDDSPTALRRAADDVIASVEQAYRTMPAGSAELPWAPWRPGLAELLNQEGYTVYVDFTAKWCLTCQTNKAVALHQPGVVATFRELGVVPLIADFTRPNPAIQRELERFRRAGVPLNLIYPKGRVPRETASLTRRGAAAGAPRYRPLSVTIRVAERAGRSPIPATGSEESPNRTGHGDG